MASGNLRPRPYDDGVPNATPIAASADQRDRGHVDQIADLREGTVRWFGGTLLGTGGLVRAYSDAVRAALDEATILTRQRVAEVDVRVGHHLAGRLEHDLRARGVAVPHVGYAERVTLRVQVPAGEADDLPGLLAGLTSGEAEVVAGSEGEGWLDVPG